MVVTLAPDRVGEVGLPDLGAILGERVKFGPPTRRGNRLGE